MAVETRKPLRGGLNIGADPAQTAGMLVADGARYDIQGVVTARLGQIQAPLEFPYEGVGNASDYVQTFQNFASPTGGTQGLAAFYDQRIVTEVQEILRNGEFTDDTVVPGSPDFWTASGRMSLTAGDDGVIRYTSAGGASSGELTQTAANFDAPLKANTTYEIRYSLTNSTPATFTEMYITTALTGQREDLVRTTGDHVYRFSTGSGATGNFVLHITDNGGAGTIDIYYISIKELGLFGLTLPERLNFVMKSSGGIWFNDIRIGDSYGPRRAKLITYGRDVFIDDPDTRPKILRRLPNREQRFLKRVAYEVRTCGIDWPRKNEDLPRVTRSGTSTPTYGLETGIYRFRIALENKMGDVSNPSLSVVLPIHNAFNPVITFPALPNVYTSGTDACSHWRIYVSYEPGQPSGTSTVVLPIGDGPTAYRLWKRVPIGTESVEYTLDDHQKHNQEQLMDLERGAPPKLRDMAIIGDVGYGIADYDTIYRESTLLSGEGRPLHFTARRRVSTANQPGFERAAYDSAVIQPMPVGPDFLFISPPGEPQYMEVWIRFGYDGEIGVGISQLGKNPVIFTNIGIIVMDPDTLEMRRVVSEVGAMTRDGIQHTERGIRFIGSDGVPRVFNGATADTIDDEVSPVFNKEDYDGYYKRFDQGLAGAVTTTFGNSRFWMSYPVSSSPAKAASGGTSSQTAARNLLVCDETSPDDLFGIDTRAFVELLWLGRENRLCAVDSAGWFYFLEEGFVDENANVPDTAPPFNWQFRWFSTGGLTRFHMLKIECDTKGQDMTVIARVDKKPALQHTFIVNKDGRRLFESKLPPWFKGLYLELEFIGTTHSTRGRPEIYDVQVDKIPLGVFA